jgi:hypothetical protein
MQSHRKDAWTYPCHLYSRFKKRLKNAQLIIIKEEKQQEESTIKY